MGSDRQDEFKWFGEGFDGFPRRPLEDTVEYVIYINGPRTNLREYLQQIEKAAIKLLGSIANDYIWQRDKFNLQLLRQDGKPLAAKEVPARSATELSLHLTLRGKTNYGDSIADEWLIVYVLRELSKMFADSWIRVYDSDGEFLLIEAANALPSWLKPEAADNRVWLNKGRIVIISPPQGDKESGPRVKGLSIYEALSFIQSNSDMLIHSSQVEQEAFFRIRDYPAEISTHQHTALVNIPRNLAYVLHQNPSYISHAIEAFYLRDPISLKLLRDGEASGFNFLPQDLVVTSVKFPKAGYAQLISQEFAAPSIWKQTPLDTSKPDVKRQNETGMKIACGFEMLLVDPQHQNNISVREIKILLEDLESGEDSLPSNETIIGWGRKQDDESWLDINFDAFERELADKGNLYPGDKQGNAPGPSSSGFGDKSAQENLQKIVERFQAFLDEEESSSGDDDSLHGLDDSSSDGENEISFDQEKFSQLLEDMMGISPEKESLGTRKQNEQTDILGQDTDDEHEAEDIEKLIGDMETELSELGILDLQRNERSPAMPSIPNTPHKWKAENGTSTDATIDQTDSEENVDDDGGSRALDIDFHVAKSILESLETQAGMPGPTSNLLQLIFPDGNDSK